MQPLRREGTNKIGRIDPATMAITEYPLPNGAVWYSESGVKPNTIVRYDPQTKKFTAWPVPSGGGVIRNMTATLQGDIYIACSGVNKVGVVRTK